MQYAMSWEWDVPETVLLCCLTECNVPDSRLEVTTGL